MNSSDICLSMIVKDEAHVIERCLRSVKPFVGSWAVVDTGSSDETQNLVRAVLGDLPGSLEERQWADFATNRNQALDLARLFGVYAMFIDADDTLHVEDPAAFGHLEADVYSIEDVRNGVSALRPFLARLDKGLAWKGVLHEALVSPDTAVRRQKFAGAKLVAHDDGARSRRGLQEKYARDAEVLRQALEQEPHNSRYAFYLAHSLRESKQWHEAIAAYRRRAEMGGWAEEIYFSKLMVATLQQHLGESFEAVSAAYRDAYAFRPERAEAPAQFAHYLNDRKEFAAARDYARIACAAPATKDTLLVNVRAYGWAPWDDLAVASYALGEFSECAGALRRALSFGQLPAAERERMERNLLKVSR